MARASDPRRRHERCRLFAHASGKKIPKPNATRSRLPEAVWPECLRIDEAHAHARRLREGIPLDVIEENFHRRRVQPKTTRIISVELAVSSIALAIDAGEQGA